MADRKISDLTALTTPASGDFLPIVDISEAAAASKNKRITIEELFRGVPLGTAAAPSIAIEGDEDTGVFSPGANQLAVATNGTQRLTVDTAATTSTLPVVHPLGAVGTPSITFTGDLNTGFYSPSADTLAAVTAGANRLHITSAGLVGIGTSAPSELLDIASANDSYLRWEYYGASGSYNTSGGVLRIGPYYGATDRELALYTDNSNSSWVTTGTAEYLVLGTNKTARIYIDSTGKVGIGTPAAATTLDVNGDVTITDRIIHGGNTNTAIRFPAADTVSVETAGSERCRIDSSGRLLVGTSSARANFFNSTVSAALQVEGTGNDSSSLSIVRNSADTGRAILTLAKTRGGSVGSTTVVQSGDALGSIEFQGSDGTEFVQAAAIQCEVDGTPSANDLPGRLVFSTTADGASSPTERMRIASGGNTDVFSDNDTLASRTSVAAGTTRSTFVGFHSATSTQNGTISCRIWSNGNVQNTNGSYTTLSDAKLKENIVDAGSQWDDLKAIQIRNWNFKAETGHETHRQIGPIAQELETVCPGLVFETPDRDADGNETGEVTKGVSQSVLYMKAVKALQEAMERIETLEANNTDLLARVTALESA